MENTGIPRGTVVVGLDGSPNSLRALDWAIDHARRERRALTLVHGIDPAGSAWSDPLGGSHRAVLEAMAADGQAVLASGRQYVAERAPELDIHDASSMSDPRVLLLELSQTAHLLVVGSRGRGPVRSLLLGSVGVALIRHAGCPVVVVRPSDPDLERHGVVVGTDAGEDSRAVVEFAYHQASLRQLPLTILHGVVDPWPPDATDDDLALPASEALAGLAEKFPDVQAQFEIVRDDPSEALMVRSRHMDLVVLGAHHGGRVSALFGGSVAQSVVEHAEGPVVVVPVTQRP